MNYSITSTTKESDDNNKRQSDNVIVLSGQAYLNFVNAIKSPNTRKLYDIALKRYMRFINAKNIEDQDYLRFSSLPVSYNSLTIKERK
jgi:hypothetical protein